jgi:uncharacterized protein
VKPIVKTLTFTCFLLIFFIKIFSQSDFSIDKSPLPPPTSPVMDYVGILDEATKKSLEKRLIDFRNQTNPSVEIAVCIVPTTGGRDIFEYSLAVARGWGIGSKEDDNPGLLLLIAFNDRKYFTQVSRDLEDELPDSLVGQIQRQYLVPAFRQQNYAKGITDTIEAYIAVIQSKNKSQQPTTSHQKDNQKEEDETLFSLIFKLLVVFILVIWIIWPLLSVLFPSIRRKRGRLASSESSTPFFTFLSSEDSSSSSWDSGDSSWGDWGGFGGGGDFGGGGAGGDW